MPSGPTIPKQSEGATKSASGGTSYGGAQDGAQAVQTAGSMPDGLSDQEIIDRASKNLNDLDSHTVSTKAGNVSEETLDSGVNDDVVGKFPGASVQTGGAASGRVIPEDQGGAPGDASKSEAFEGIGDIDDKRKVVSERIPGSVNMTGDRTEAIHSRED